jgi:hypothetical protein
LLTQAEVGPVVSFNISSYRSDALLLTRDGIACLELPGLTRKAVLERISVFHQALRATAHPDSGTTDRKAQDRLCEILRWLWDTAAGPVLYALGYRSEPAPDAVWPRVWWAPGGLLSLLPIHAAGYHNESASRQGRHAVMDRVVSSYTPTIRALRHARQRIPAVGTEYPALVVAMPTTPGVAGRLPNVSAEVAMLVSRLHESVLLIEPESPGSDPAVVSADTPTKANVLAHLPDHPIAHFACHGATDPTDPSNSLLMLHDWQSDPLTVASLAPIKLDRAQLAYLSACRTAFTGTAELIDEAIHLTSAFQLAGFPHVIGTLWEIDDQLAVAVAGDFYTALRTGSGALDISHAARALHRAVRPVRDALPGAPSLWAAFLHAGV